MAKIAPLFSSSKGNSIFVGNDSDGILIDCGCSFRALKNSLELCGIPFEAIKAVLITHEHTDHINGLQQLMKHTSLPVFASDKTAEKIREKKLTEKPERISGLTEIGTVASDIEVSYFHTPHDSAECVGYVLSFAGHKVACCTDLGHVTNEVRSSLLGCDCVYIEANYDPYMLRSNPNYPDALKQRISGENGHLSNPDSAEFCSELVKNGAVRLILGHLSPENNTPSVACDAVYRRLLSDGAVCKKDYTLDVAKVNTDGRYIAI